MPVLRVLMGWVQKARCHTVWNIPLVSSGQLSWLCPLPTAYSPPAYSLRRWRGVEGKSLDAVQALLSNSQNINVLPTLFLATDCKHSTILAATKKVDSIPARPVQAISLRNMWCKVDFGSLVKEMSLFTRKFALE